MTKDAPKTPEDFFVVFGYFEELLVKVGDRWKVLGTRQIEKPVNRALGFSGKRMHRFTENFVLSRGHKEVLIRASKNKPIDCEGYAQAKCGRLL